jgi:endoglucanase
LAGGRWAGPSIGVKAAAAVLAAAVMDASAKMAKGTVAGWLAQTKFAVRGRARTTSLGAVRARNGLRPKAVILVDLIAADKAAARPALGGGPVLAQVVDRETPFRTAVEETARKAGISLQRAVMADSPLLAAFQDGVDALALALPVRYLHSPAETVDLKDAEALAALLVQILQQGGGK